MECQWEHKFPNLPLKTILILATLKDLTVGFTHRWAPGQSPLTQHSKVNQPHTHGFPSQTGAQEGIAKTGQVPRLIVKVGRRQRNLEGLYEVDEQPSPYPTVTLGGKNQKEKTEGLCKVRTNSPHSGINSLFFQSLYPYLCWLVKSG